MKTNKVKYNLISETFVALIIIMVVMFLIVQLYYMVNNDTNNIVRDSLVFPLYYGAVFLGVKGFLALSRFLALIINSKGKFVSPLSEEASPIIGLLFIILSMIFFSLVLFIS